MPYVFKGNIYGTIDSQSQSLPQKLDYFTLVNKTASTIGVNVYLISGIQSISMIPLNQQLATGEMFYADSGHIVLATEQIRLQTSGSTDYIFTLSDLEI